MGHTRIKLDSRREAGVYHCVTRTVAGERLLGEVEREVLARMLWRVAEFSGVEVLAYCILSNHFHVLVRVPEVKDGDLDRAELLRRYRALYGNDREGFFPHPDTLEKLFADPESGEAARWEARLRVRMNDVSEFMKTLKQRFSIWFNHTRGRFGTLWAERFRSMVVEDAPAALRVVAAYIDLNPVRAGIVDDPGAYRWSSYGEAIAGQEAAQKGLASAMGAEAWESASTDYRLMLFGKGFNARIGEQGSIAADKVKEVIEQGGVVPESVLLRCRLRFLTAGAVLGSRAYVLELSSRLGLGGRQRRRRGTAVPLEARDSLITLFSVRKGAIG